MLHPSPQPLPHLATDPFVARSGLFRAGRFSRRGALWPRLVPLVLVGILVSLWGGFLEERLLTRGWGSVIEGRLYRGPQLSRWQLEPRLTRHGIQAVIDLSPRRASDVNQQRELELSAVLGLEHRRFPLREDGTGDLAVFAAALMALHRDLELGRVTLIHAGADALPAAGVIAAYRMLVQGVAPANALTELRRAGWNPARDLALTAYLRDNAAALTDLLRAAGIPAQAAIVPPLAIQASARL